MKNYERRVIIITSGMIVKTLDTIDQAITWVKENNIQQYEILPVTLTRD